MRPSNSAPTVVHLTVSAFLDEMIVTEDILSASKLRRIPRTPERNAAVSSAVSSDQLERCRVGTGDDGSYLQVIETPGTTGAVSDDCW